MKIGIITQPLLGNYGGVLQNWALQQVIKDLNHVPVTIDYQPQTELRHFVLSTLKTILLYFIPVKRRKFIPRQLVKRNNYIDNFVETKIQKTRVYHKYSPSLIRSEKLDAIIVGSDQVWRPMYNVSMLPDMFLQFAQKFKGKKIVYAASFGVDVWEYTDEQTVLCAKLVKQFNALSVREESGVLLCKKHLGVTAIPVLDPTLLIKREQYEDLCSNIPLALNKFILAYILDSSEETERIIADKSKEYGLPVYRCSADKKANISVEEWIAMFRDANFVITDSFHGTIFSIIFNKPFKCVANGARGVARFADILKKYHENKLSEWRERSLSYLKDACR